MKKVALIGAGQLGSRHLQALAKCSTKLTIYVIDSNLESLEIARQRFEEVEGYKNHDVEWAENIASLPSYVDFCVIATAAKPRLAILKALLNHSKVQYLVLEKVAFLSERQFEEAADLLAEGGVKCWVNCPRRMNPAYKRLRSVLADEEAIDYMVEGDNYGLACNSIHFLDNMAMLAQDSEVVLDISGINPVVEESKRGGYVEFSGELTGKFSKGSNISLKCTDTEDGKVTVTIHISSPNYELVINEPFGEVNVLRDNTGALKDFAYKTIYQSSLTDLIAEDLFANGTCELTPFEESRDLHVPFLNAFIGLMETLENRKVDYLPIT